MRELTAKSLKLNRDIAKMLPEAMEKDRLIKIGYGSGGDLKPRNGEFGVITHLPPKSRVLILGDLGECVGGMNRGGSLTVEGACGSMLGAFQTDGRVVVERDVGDRAGFHMSGGSITIHGSAGQDAGAGMSGGALVVRGHVGGNVGAGMSGGVVIIMGSAGPSPGVGISGGKIVIAGSCPPPGQGASMRSITDSEIEDFSVHLEPLGLSVGDDALVLEAEREGKSENVRPLRWVSEGFQNIGIFPSATDRLSEQYPVESGTTVMPVGKDEGGLFFQIPWLIRGDEGNTIEFPDRGSQPAMVGNYPQENDLLIVGREGLSNATDNIVKCSGVVLDLADLPPLNDAEIEALVVSLTGTMAESSLIFLRDGVERVEHLFRLVTELDLDGAVVHAGTPGGNRGASALPRVGLASRAMDFESQGRTIAIEMDNVPSSEDLIIAVSAGCSLFVGPVPDDGELGSHIAAINSGLSGWMREVGVGRISMFSRRNLRAMDMDTAAISGLRLVGFERPLPMWLGN